MNTSHKTYSNTARSQIWNFVQELGPTPSEAPFIQNVFEKRHISMKDVKILLEFVARRATETPLQADCIKILGLPSLPA
ncbi:hypothetical protein XMG7_003229 [Aliiroseovarius sp. xm-g-7]|nr:hypothetical protein [Aliiroseovarius sp. xm-g-7]